MLWFSFLSIFFVSYELKKDGTMKSKILKILGVLALTTLSVNTMAWKVNYFNDQDRLSLIDMLDDEVKSTVDPTNAFQNSNFSFGKFDTVWQCITSLSGEEKADCLILEANGAKLSIDIDALQSVNESLVQELEQFLNFSGNRNKLDEKFLNKIESTVASYHIAKILKIDAGTYNNESEFIQSAVQTALSHDGGKINRERLLSKIEDKLFGGKSEDIKKASDALILLNLCFNKCEGDAKKVLITFFDEVPASADARELEAIDSVLLPFFDHSCKHITPMNIVLEQLQNKWAATKGLKYEKQRLEFGAQRREELHNYLIKLLNSKTDEVTRLIAEKNQARDASEKDLCLKKLAKAQKDINTIKLQIDSTIKLKYTYKNEKKAVHEQLLGAPNKKPLDIFDSANELSSIIFENKDLKVENPASAPEAVRNFMMHLVKAYKKNGSFAMLFDNIEIQTDKNNNLQFYVPSDNPSGNRIRFIPLLNEENGTDDLWKIGLKYSVHQAKISRLPTEIGRKSPTKIAAALTAATDPVELVTLSLFFKLVIPILSNKPIRDTEFGSVFPIVNK